MKQRHKLGMLLATAGGTALVLLGLARGQQVHRNGFEAREVAWVKGPTDTVYRELAHDMTDATAHHGQLSEHLQLVAEQGSSIQYLYAVGRAPVTDETSASLWLKANRPGVQLAARVVLPKERNPGNLDEPLTVLLRGDAYQLVSRWQRLDLRRPLKLMRDQQQLMRAELNRDVDFSEAYIDRLVLNVYCGPGQTEVWIDDLEVGPVLENAPPFQATSRPVERGAPSAPAVAPARPPSKAAVVELNQNQLLVNGRRFFFRGIRHTDTPLKVLRDAGFNTVWFDAGAPPALLDEAVQLGFYLVPTLPNAGDEPQATPAGLSQNLNHFLERDGLLFWDVGGGLSEEQAVPTVRTARQLKGADPQHPLGADVWDGFGRYSSHVELIGVHRWPLMTAMELTEYREWLDQRRRLLVGHRGTFLWTWVQTHLPDWYTTLVYQRTGAEPFTEPVGPQPEQIKLVTYVALAAGCRGLGFWSDRFLADSHQGRDRLLGLALLNMELKMLEPLLLNQVDDPVWIGTSLADVKAAVLRTERGVLVLPMWLGKGAQFVPGQEATASLTVTVPQVPNGAQAWLVSPGELRCLGHERVPGGTRIKIPEFSLTAAVLFTSDNGSNGMVVRLQDQARQNCQVAAQWAHDQAAVELEKVTKVHAELERLGHTLPDGQALLDDARRRLEATAQHWKGGEYRKAYLEAQRVLRPLRIYMRAQYELALKNGGQPLESAVASPYAVSFFSLPRHWMFMDQVNRMTPGQNLLPEGGFEVNPARTAESWSLQETTLDNVDLVARRVDTEPHEGKQCLMLQINARNKELTPQALERTFLAINSPVVRLQPGTLVRVSGWIRVPDVIHATADGALLYDSAGGEPLAVRLRQYMKWKQFTLYRQVPASGTIQVTLALTGLGTVFFDDIRIEPLEPGATPPSSTRPPAVPVSRVRP
jgi:hypothetical protein